MPSSRSRKRKRPVSFEYTPASIDELRTLLASHGVSEALIKPLRRNHNDKNQVYSGTEFAPLYPMFDLDFRLRAASTSGKKGGGTRGKAIPEAVFLSTRVVVMSPRPGRITDVIDVDLGHRRDVETREADAYFKKVTEVREALRGIENAGAQPGIEDR